MTETQNPNTPDRGPPREVRIVSHTMLFYWWPVWAVGLLMAGLTWMGGHYLAIVPAGTKAVDDFNGDRQALVLPAGGHLAKDPATGEPRDPTIRVTRRSGLGIVFVVVLLLVILITNVPIRGLWSVLVIVTLLMSTVLLAVMGWWDDILEALGSCHIYINAYGYLAISLPLLVFWIVVVLFFDRRTYMIFSPGQMRVYQEVGGGEAAFDTHGMVLAKRRSDLFRHWLLGLGSGDLIVKTAGAHPKQIEMFNVLFISSKLSLVQDMLQTRETVSA